MRQRTLGKNGPRVSAIGYGAMVLSPGIYGAVNEESSLKTINHALDRGVTFFDTAFAYGGGHNEELLGRALRAKRDSVVLATKGGFAFEGGRPVIDGRPATLRGQLEASLKRLGTPQVDLYYLHTPDPKVPVEESVGEMARFVKEGKARFLGVSNLSPEQLRKAHAVHPIHASQDQYSLFFRRVEGEGRREVLRELGVALIAYSPLGQGVLGGGLKGSFEPGDFRAYSPRFQGQNLTRANELGQRFYAIAAEAGVAPATLALAWLLHRGDDIVPIPGTRSVENLDANLAAAELELKPELLARLEEAFPPSASMASTW
jgi:aryl-alcohol dehydrogenase-like predicted oxidoreductase